jgi:hypothetical protein
MSFWNKHATSIIFVVLIFLYSLYYSIDFQKNEHLVNVTVNNITTEQAKVYYDRMDYVPVRNIGDNSRDQFTITQVIFITLGCVVYIFFMTKQDLGRWRTHDEQKKVIKELLLANADIKKDSIMIFNQTFFPKTQVDDKEPQPVGRYIFTKYNIKDELGHFSGEKIYAYKMNIFNDYIEDILEMNDFPVGNHWRCDICGKFPDKKVFSPTGFKQLTEFNLKTQGGK